MVGRSMPGASAERLRSDMGTPPAASFLPRSGSKGTVGRVRTSLKGAVRDRGGWSRARPA